MIVCLEKSKRYDQKTVRHSKVANMIDYKVNTQNLIVFLHTKNSNENNGIRDHFYNNNE